MKTSDFMWPLTIVLIFVVCLIYLDRCSKKSKPCPEVDTQLFQAIQNEAGHYRYLYDSAVRVNSQLSNKTNLARKKWDSLSNIIKRRTIADTVHMIETVYDFMQCDSLAIEYADFKQQVNHYVLQTDSLVAAAWDEKEALASLSEMQGRQIKYLDSMLVFHKPAPRKCKFFRKIFCGCK